MKIMRYLLIFTFLSSGLMQGAHIEMETPSVFKTPEGKVVLFSNDVFKEDKHMSESLPEDEGFDVGFWGLTQIRNWYNDVKTSRVDKILHKSDLVKRAEFLILTDLAVQADALDGTNTEKVAFIHYFGQYRDSNAPWRGWWFRKKVANLFRKQESFLYGKPFDQQLLQTARHKAPQQRNEQYYLNTVDYIINHEYLDAEPEEEESKRLGYVAIG